VVIFDSSEVNNTDTTIGDDGQPVTAVPSMTTPSGVPAASGGGATAVIGGSSNGSGVGGSTGAQGQPAPITAQSLAALKKRQARESERTQRLLFLHGNTLVISLLLKTLHNGMLPYGLPDKLLMDTLDLGLQLLQQDVLGAPAIHHIHCSLLRAGSLIVSSCLGLGYKIVRERLGTLYKACTTVFEACKAAEESSAVDLIYEIMCVEAMLVCLAALLRSCPEVIQQDRMCIPFMVEALEAAFKALKGYYL
jgi:hypothetical protein